MSDFNRGYFCAIAKLVKIEGLVSEAAKELFNAGENPRPLGRGGCQRAKREDTSVQP